MTRLIGISGRKQAGKNTTANFMYGNKMLEHELVKDFRIGDDGSLQVYTANSAGVLDWGLVDITSHDSAFLEYAEQEIWPYIKLYSFSDALKAMCVKLLGISYTDAYGNDVQKSTLTHIRWENMPGVIADAELWNHILELYPEGLEPVDLIYHEKGYMTAREVMQYFGTEVMRRIHGPIWIDSTMKRIKEEGPEIAIIADVRFPNEADAVLDEDGELIRLTRFIEDNHISETALNPQNFDQNKFTYLVDNQDKDIGYTLKKVGQIYREEIKKVEFVGFRPKAVTS